jgi:putative NADH-flavin reductase
MDILVPALFVAIGVAALIAATIGSVKRDREFQRRYRAASESERRDLEKLRPSSLSWTWVNSPLKKWAVAMYAFLALFLGAAWWLRR